MFKDSEAVLNETPFIKSIGTARSRLTSVDFLRGLVMVLMALDHVRDFFTDVRFYPLDLTQTNPELFMTRWITHFCAPVFVFLAGTGAFLSGTRGKSKKELSKFLFTRGLWLILLELTIVRWGWVFNFDYTHSFGQVIWAIGWSMIVLSGLIFLSLKTIAFFGILIIAVHNAFDGVTPGQLGIFGWSWQILHYGGPIEYAPGYIFFAAYPLIPWIGVMAAGYGFGVILLFEEKKRRKTLLQLGFGLTILFIILRASNLYGDPYPWQEEKNFLFTFFSFINTEKYPPSLLFLLMTLGPAIASLVFFEKIKGAAAKFFIIFGRVPLFYYVLHIPLIHGIAVAAAYVSGIDTGFMFSNNPPWLWQAEWGYNLLVVYLVWIAVVLILYPVCLWYAEVKRKSNSRMLSYL